MRRRYADVDRAPGTPLTTYHPDAMTRHGNRLDFNYQHQQEVARWCMDHGVKLEIKNDRHHWMFRRDNRLVEWWPSSAKLVVDRKYNRGLHVHDYRQAIVELEKVFPKVEQPKPTVDRLPDYLL